MTDFAKWDSLAHVNLMLELEKQFKKVSTSKMSDLNSVNKILQFFQSKIILIHVILYSSLSTFLFTYNSRSLFLWKVLKKLIEK